MSGRSTSPVMLLLIFLGMLGHTIAQSTPQGVTRIDDSNIYSSSNPTGIQYSPAWQHLSGDVANGRYNNTLSVTQADNASVVYFFKGSSVAYYADSTPTSGYVYVTLDGFDRMFVSPGSPGGLQQLLWSQSDLSDEDHQLIISRSNGSFGNMTLDYLEVKLDKATRLDSLGPGSINVPPELVNIVDDSDSRITYAGNWLTWNSTARSFYYGGYQRVSQTPGSSLSFTFNGKSVWYFTDQHATNGRALITIDGSKGDLVNTALPGARSWVSQALCWSKTGLSDGPHTVNVTHWDGQWVGLDFFAYSSVDTPGDPNGTKKALIGAIVGGVVGGMVGLGLALLLYRLFSSDPRRDR